MSEPVSPTTIHVWHATSSSNQPGAIEHCCRRWLQHSECERADRFRVATSRNQNIVGRGMARRLLDLELDDPRTIRFEVEPHGKPFVVEPDTARRPFNIAHTDGLVLCGVGAAEHRFVGIDVEKLERRTDPELADRYFAAPEVAYLRQIADGSERREAFLKIWTLKESFIKAIGTGLHTPLADFAFEGIESESPQIRLLAPNLMDDLCWKFFSVQPRPGYIGAIAVACRDSTTAVQFELNCFDDLVAVG